MSGSQAMSSRSEAISSHPPIIQRMNQEFLLDEETEEVTIAKDKVYRLCPNSSDIYSLTLQRERGCLSRSRECSSNCSLASSSVGPQFSAPRMQKEGLTVLAPGHAQPERELTDRQRCTS